MCGCDGMNYDNECVAHSVGVSVRSVGRCVTDVSSGAPSKSPGGAYEESRAYGKSSDG